jgi:four helix bundle protein
VSFEYLSKKYIDMRNFKELKIWQKGFKIAVDSLRIISAFPKDERFEISNQISRAAVSIPSNIAEGSSRSSQREYARFAEIALGSSFELETQLLIAKAVNYGKQEEIETVLKEVDEEQKMIMSFITKLNQ